MALDLEKYVSASWVSRIPSPQTAIEQAERNPAALVARQVFGSFETGELAVGRSWLSWGSFKDALPASLPAIGKFEEYRDLLQKNPLGSTVWSQTGSIVSECMGGGSCTDAVLQGAAKTANAAFAQVTGSVPVLGWIAQTIGLAVSVGSIIWKETQGEADPQVAPLSLNAAADQERGEELMAQTGAEDWTPLFLPEHDPSTGGFLQVRDAAFPGKNEVGGRLWMGSQAGPVVPLGKGLLPGQSEVAVEWQFRGKQASTGSTALDRVLSRLNIPIAEGKNASRYTTYGLEFFRPSMSQISSILWTEVMGSVPAMMRVDANKLSKNWNEYWQLWIKALNVFAGDNDETKILTNVLMGRLGRNPFGWPWFGAKLKQEVNDRYLDFLPVAFTETGQTYNGMDLVAPQWGEGITLMTTRRGWTLRYCDNLRERQRRVLNSVQVAYLTGDEPALSGDFKDLFEENRKKLLDHAALSKVDFARVPPSPWKDEAVLRSIKKIKMPGEPDAIPGEPGGKILTPSFPWGQGGMAALGPGELAPESGPTKKRGSVLPLAAAAAGAFFLLPKLFK